MYKQTNEGPVWVSGTPTRPGKDGRDVNPYDKKLKPEDRGPRTHYNADGSGYVESCGPGGPLYFDINGNS